VIEVEHLTKRYGPRTAVEDVSFRVERGEIVGFLGPNGAGKTTTLRMLTGFLAPSEGSIRIDGIDALAHPIAAKRRVGYMPETYPLYPEMRVREYLRYRAELKGVARREIPAFVARAIEQAGVTEAADRIIGQLSKGTRQRVGLADALVADPPILVLDEPTAGLDPNQIRQVRELVRGLAKTKTVLLSTHILPEVEATCDRVVIIHRGRLIREGTPDELRRATVGTALYIEGRAPGAPDPLAAFRAVLAKVPGVRTIERSEVGAERVVRLRVAVDDEAEVAERVARAIALADLALREIRPERAGALEEVFGRLTMTEALPSGPQAGEDDQGHENRSLVAQKRETAVSSPGHDVQSSTGHAPEEDHHDARGGAP
jgi:ABC-2 type transport system ATP-binding protein